MDLRTRPPGGRISSWIGSALGVAALAIAPSVAAGRAPLALGQVTTRLDRDSDALRSAFRSAVERELSGIDLSKVKPSDRYVLSAALVKMDTRADGERTETTCVVSAMLTRERGGALHAIIRGRARAEDAPSEARSVELSAMRAAVHSALIRVPEALR